MYTKNYTLYNLYLFLKKNICSVVSNYCTVLRSFSLIIYNYTAIFSEFLCENFDSIKFSSDIIQNDVSNENTIEDSGVNVLRSSETLQTRIGVDGCLSRLESLINHVDGDIQNLITTHHSALFSHVGKAGHVKSLLHDVEREINQLVTTVHLIREKIICPYINLKDVS